MKRLTIVTIMLVLLTSMAFSQDDPDKSYEGVPEQLQGMWYAYSYSEDKGATVNNVNAPLFSVTEEGFFRGKLKIFIETTEMYIDDNKTMYILRTAEPEINYMVIFYNDLPKFPVLFGFHDKEEVFRTCVDIRP